MQFVHLSLSFGSKQSSRCGLTLRSSGIPKAGRDTALRFRTASRPAFGIRLAQTLDRTKYIPLDVLYPNGYSRRMFTVRQTEVFVAWLDALKDKRAQIRIAAHLRLAEAGSLGDWEPIEGEVSEMRVHFGPGYRLYFVRRGRVIVVMLNGGDKSTQKRDIRQALKLASELGDDL